MTFSRAVAEVEDALMEIGLKDIWGGYFEPTVMTMKLDLHFDDAWSKLVSDRIEGKISDEQLRDAGLILAQRLSLKVFQRRMHKALVSLDQGEAC
jgi:hypothetical protein